MLRIKVANFGPIAEGAVDIKPLTIFIGQNNSGKSYLATLVYALFQAIRPAMLSPFGFRFRMVSPRLTSKSLQPFKQWLRKAYLEKTFAIDEAHRLLRLPLLSPEAMEALREITRSLLADLSNDLARELRRCYGSEIADLVRNQRRSGSLSIGVEQEGVLASFRFSSADSKLSAETHQFGPFEQPVEMSMPAGVLKHVAKTHKFSKDDIPPVELVVLSIIEKLFQDLRRNSYYLPAARSGILQSHRALSSFIVSRAPLAGIQPMEIPRLTGVVADFISSIITIDKHKVTKLKGVAKSLEEVVVGGSIGIELEKGQYPEIFYQDALAGKFPLHRTSSMVSEVAPIVLFLRYLVNPGDLLVIEEPEAHLHPENQRKLAQALVMLVKSDVRVLITTHSDYLVQQLSNSITRGKANAMAPGEPSSQDFLKPEDVGAFLFKSDPAKEGSLIEEIPVTPEEGISEEEFGRVTAELYEETVSLRRKVLP